MTRFYYTHTPNSGVASIGFLIKAGHTVYKGNHFSPTDGRVSGFFRVRLGIFLRSCGGQRQLRDVYKFAFNVCGSINIQRTGG